MSGGRDIFPAAGRAGRATAAVARAGPHRSRDDGGWDAQGFQELQERFPSLVECGERLFVQLIAQVHVRCPSPPRPDPRSGARAPRARGFAPLPRRGGLGGSRARPLIYCLACFRSLLVSSADKLEIDVCYHI
jgi:hypothetical protein